MKQSITQNLLLSNSLYKKSFLKILFLTTLVLFFVFLFLLFYFNEAKEKENEDKRHSIEKIINNSLVSSAKYGDVVYSRANSLVLGKDLGLVDLGVCDKSVDIFERPHETRCKNISSSSTTISFGKAVLNGQNYELEFHWKKEKQSIFDQLLYSLLLSLGFAFFFLLPLQLWLLNFVLKKVQDVTHHLIEEKFNSETEDLKVKSEVVVLDEFVPLARFIESKTEELKHAVEDRAITNLAQQVSHDIRSPLAALTMMLSEVDSVPMDQRSMIHNSLQRINDIANNLLSSSGKQKKEKSVVLKEELLFFTIDSLISEKRIEFRNRAELEIELKFLSDRRVFAKIDKVEFQRMLSNLINNAIEAMSHSGKLIISISNDSSGTVQIKIEDNGKGIPSQVLEKIGAKGFSYGKEGQGNGLGLYHAKEVMRLLNGKLGIKSTENIGTVVILSLPIAYKPAWFANELIIPKNKKIFAVDDDKNIFNLWMKKLGFATTNFTNGESFSEAIKNEKDSDYVCLVDYEIQGHEYNGLDLIEKLKLANNSYLVTSRFEEKIIQERCQKMGVKIVPKALVEWIPIKEFEKSDKKIFDYVCIDDEKIILLNWESRARKKGIELLTLNSTADFKKHSERISKEDTLIYIDSDLGTEAMAGEEFAKLLHEEGYRNIFIASGYGEERFSHYPWLQYAGKVCPF